MAGMQIVLLGLWNMCLQELTEWVNGQRGLKRLGTGYFTVNAAAAAAVRVASKATGCKCYRWDVGFDYYKKQESYVFYRSL